MNEEEWQEKIKVRCILVTATFKLRGTLKEINRMKARIAALSTCEEVYSMGMKEET